MRGVRVRWSAAGKLALVAVVALLALQLLPSLLRAPAPPPLAKDVGLPRVEVAPEPAEVPPPPARQPRPSPEQKPRMRRSNGAPKVRTGSKPRFARSKKRRHVPAAVPSPPPPAPPPPAPEPPAEPVSPPPAAAPPPPDDGSAEFAPH